MADTVTTSAPVPPDAVVPAAPVTPPAARFVNPVTKTVPLAYPVEFNGIVYTQIGLHRMTAREVADFAKSIESGGIVKPPCIDAPQEVLEALDDDDAFELDKAVADFLPRRFRATTEKLTSGAGAPLSLS